MDVRGSPELILTLQVRDGSQAIYRQGWVPSNLQVRDGPQEHRQD